MRWPSRTSGSDEGGFTVLETTVALSLVFLVLTGGLATYASSVRGVVDGRQRSGAVTVARSVVEDARAALYSQVGHDLAGDATLDDDPELTGSPPVFEGEELVGAPAPTFPEHRWTEQVDTTTYTVRVYVTWVTPPSADPYKRLTVVVGWTTSLYETSAAVDDQVRLSSFLFPAGVPPDPLLDGTGDVDAGTFAVTGTLDDVAASRATLFQPVAVGDVRSLFTRESEGQARSSSATVELTTGSLTGCDVSDDGLTSTCSGVREDTSTDSDAATAVPEHATSGPTFDGAHTISAGSDFSLGFGADTAAESQSTARSCFDCFATDIGDDDRLAYHWSEGTGADSVDVTWDVGAVAGSLFRMSSPPRATTSLDQDPVSGDQMLTVSGQLTAPGADVVTIDSGAPADFDGAVLVGAVDVVAEAQVGPTSESPSITGAAVAVDVYDTLDDGSLGYRSLSFDPGEDREETASATFTVDGAEVTLTTTVASGGKSVTSSTDDSGTIVDADASLTGWLRITVEVLVTETDDDGNTVTRADATAELDYGHVAARASYEEAS